MKVRIASEELAQEIRSATHVEAYVGHVFDAWPNDERAWADEDGVPYFCEIVLERGVRSELGWWAHENEVEVLKPSEELAALGHPGYSDDFADEVLLYMVENDASARVAVQTLQAKDLVDQTRHRTKKPDRALRDLGQFNYRASGIAGMGDPWED